MPCFKVFRAALLSTSIFITGATSSLAMERENDKENSSTMLLKQVPNNINSL